MAPAYAMPRMLDRNGLSLQDFDLYEIHEAFASQVLATLAAWEDEDFNRERLGRDEPFTFSFERSIDPSVSLRPSFWRQNSGSSQAFSVASTCEANASWIS